MSHASIALPAIGTFDFKGEPAGAQQTRSHFLQLQALVAIILSYQVLFTQSAAALGQTQMAAVLGLLLTCGAIMVAPERWVVASWFPGALALGDTAIVTALIYWSGNLSSELYLAYFAILLIATMARSQRQMMTFFGLIFALYTAVLYREVQASGLVLEQHLLRMPLLLVMAVFYGRTVETVRALTQFDSLTGLPNKRTFLSLVAERLPAARKASRALGVLSVSLEGFRMVSDTFGHQAGDQVLKAAATRIGHGPGYGHTLCRSGGSDFALLLDHVSSPDDCSALAQSLLKSMEAPFLLGTREIFVTSNIGIALFPRDAEDADGLVRNADAALSLAKQHGKNTYRLYSSDLHQQAVQRLELAQHLRKALDRQELSVFYQPQIRATTGELVGFEALLRWTHPELGPISPSVFITLAEETGLIVPIGQWTLRKACAQARAWNASGRSPVRVAVNLSVRQLAETNLAALVQGALNETGLDPGHLEIELTESLLLRDQAATIQTLHAIKRLGVRLAIDDFGTGYSALSYLQRFPVDTIKIDQSFVRSLVSNHEAQAIVRAIIGMANALSLSVVAEGVETAEQHSFLRQEGCDECQGYYFGRPVPADEAAAHLAPRPERVLHSA